MTVTEINQETSQRDRFCDGLHQLAAWLRDADPAIPNPFFGPDVAVYFHDFDAYRRVLADMGWNAYQDGTSSHTGGPIWRSTELLEFGPLKVRLVGFEPASTPPIRNLFPVTS